MTLFEFVKNQILIQDVISKYVPIKPAGTYLKASCPFHAEKDASFTVSPAKQIFYCFGCHATGDVISFVAKIENMSQLEAVQHLVDSHSLVVPEQILKNLPKDSAATSSQRDNYYRVCKLIAEWTHKKMLTSTSAKRYLLNRNVDENQILNFKIGYLPGGVASLNIFVKEMAAANVLLKDLLESGFLVQGNTFLYSPFEERILFPIKNPIGHFCGFGGRIFQANDDRSKYYNSKESEGFAKGKLLFGFDLAKKDIADKQAAFLVEGNIDCVAMVQHGYPNTVATLGTACTLDHLKLLSRFAKTLYIVYDGDTAGQKAMLRLTELCWEASLDVFVVLLPQGEDPASILSKGGSIEPYVQAAGDVFNFFVSTLTQDFQNKPLSDKMALAERIVEVISRVSNAFKQDLLLQQMALAMQVPFQSVKNLLGSFKQKDERISRYKATGNALVEQSKIECQDGGSNKEDVENSLLEEKIVSAIIDHIGKDREFEVVEALLPYFSERARRIIEKAQFMVKQPQHARKFDALLTELTQEDQNWVMKISLEFETETSKNFFDSLISRFCKENWKKLSQDFKEKIVQAQQDGDSKKIEELFATFTNLKQGLKSKGLLL